MIRNYLDIADFLYRQKYGARLSDRLLGLWRSYYHSAPDVVILTEVGDISVATLHEMARAFGWEY
jgi:hypothetical protein